MRICVITGLSGSGKSTAIRALEDEDFFCLDNLPLALLQVFIELVAKSSEKIRNVAIVIDIRARDFLKGYEIIFQELRDAGHKVEIYFLDSSDSVLIRRFSETRRRHPALIVGSVQDGIKVERELLVDLQRIATHIIDTSELNTHQLKELIVGMVCGESVPRPFNLHLQSFGFRYGVPIDSDLVMDVRFLPNPYFVPELKSFSGLDKGVREFVLAQPDTSEFLDRFLWFVDFLIPRYQREGKSYLTISVGCTGGRHRSVVIIEVLREFLAAKKILLKVTHRDMEKG
ncbi:MAG TPA: RNase adapter RapZ [Geobacteraceae bacterium]|nr:RNase adapter RapZ [Geobacteraceae bacterium]